MKIRLNRKQMIAGIAVIALFIMTIIMYFGIGLRLMSGNQEIILTGFGNGDSLKRFSGSTLGRDIYGSALTIVIFSAFLLATVGLSWFIPETKMKYKIGLYVINYLLITLILILSIVILAEFAQYNRTTTIFGVRIQESIKTVSVVFLVLFGLVWPGVVMYALFDKQLFQAIYKMGKSNDTIEINKDLNKKI